MDRISYEEKGSGRALVLIHGFCETREIWKSVGDELSRSFRVITPDLPGFGESSLHPVPFSISDVAGSVLHWLDELGLDTCVVIGHSLGGYVTLAMVEKQPERFAGFGLFHSTSYADSEEKKESRNKVIDFVNRNGVLPFIDTFVPSLFYQKNNLHIPDVYRIARQTRAETLTAYAAAMRDRPSRLDVLKNYSRPVLLIAGEGDATIPIEHAAAQSNVIRFPVFSALPNAGHMGMYESEPESIKIITDFVRLAFDFGT